MRGSRFLVALTLPLLLAGAPATAADQPLWELGIGVGALRLPHYRGSDQSSAWLLPVPYVVYRGEILKADRSGARARLLEADRFHIDLSLSASTPTRSRDNRAREGMPDLKPTVELGPNLNWTVARDDGGRWKLDLRLPVRAAISIESDPRLAGWIATPNLNLDLRGLHGWNVGLLAGPVYGNRRLHNYFYEVPAAYATPDRPTYSTRGGFAGLSATAALSRRDGRRWTGLFLKLDSLDHAVFRDSPLVRQRHQWSAGIAVSWVLAESATTVRADDE